MILLYGLVSLNVRWQTQVLSPSRIASRAVASGTSTTAVAVAWNTRGVASCVRTVTTAWLVIVVPMSASVTV